MVPQLESRVTAGPDGEILYEEIADHYPFKKWWVERLVGSSKEHQACLLLVKVRGESMIPTINPGEVILVDTYESERITIKNGSIYLVVLPDGSISLKRLAVSQRENRIWLICMSDNTAVFKPFEFELQPAQRLRNYVLGRVRWAGKEFD